ncbi:hypothetical protein [Desulfovibrio sp. TomC]|uniref:hypothetical protein n=1 Tax=Desulfovibrio sp. TomC TaxID=1562888 RepID=UPI000575C92E|nr:hypothetical protein [Desulfovibrio sp. TomC]KHK00667.1 hypothetical protein NY78_3930 [Desulfovibrio sp. TomC]
MHASPILCRALFLGFCASLVLPGPCCRPALAAPACPGVASAKPQDYAKRAAAALATTPPDGATAAACLHAAEAAGDPGAAVVLGFITAAGLDGPPDPTRAAAAYFRAADAGSPQGVLAVGLAFAHGAGVPADAYWAYWFCRRAESLGGLSEIEAATAREAIATAGAALNPAERAMLDGNLVGDTPP